ncbi:LytR C-terminal domain-containing protein [Frigoribacterium sp. VKM Ac-2836]|uniref:LytR C-terminal domain-containing protein n=1 Tax=Frigoribacterium sp. VKM Ac-2836 TaxID=2739014 RepID=UPI001566A935|nr:LytR C-terminal domain-containing protein [Frigoribacterium sp. VKM Ac-2836]NRD26896.1 LytR C-terminal domain-containing protein [Frigoribacterium sp. VKM Ac-2836]
MPKFDRDRFDDVPADLDRVGAHRAEKRPGSGWIAFAWAALAVGVLVGAGVIYLGVANNSFQFVNPSSSSTAEAEAPETETETTAPAPTPSVTPLTDPSQVDPSVTTITVLNGTATAGLAGSASDRLETAGWVIGTQGNASERVETSTVYYSAAEDEAAARGLAQQLGITDVESSDAFPGAAVTIVLGADYSA